MCSVDGVAAPTLPIAPCAFNTLVLATAPPALFPGSGLAPPPAVRPRNVQDIQKKQKRVRRADARRLRQGPEDSSLSGVGGLIAFNAFLQEEGIGRELRRRFGRLKQGHRVVYPMHTQLQLLIDAAAAGAQRVFDIEHVASDPVFEHLAGGAVPSIDTVYKDLARFDKDAIEALEALVAEQGLRPVASAQLDAVTVDIDTTVMPLFGCQEGARLGPNPRYHGRPSYHPILARVAEFDTILGARLRPGDTSMGDSDVEDVTCWVDRLREVAGPNTVITVRVDAGADCSSWFEALDGRGVPSSSKPGRQPSCSEPRRSTRTGPSSTATPTDSRPGAS